MSNFLKQKRGFFLRAYETGTPPTPAAEPPVTPPGDSTPTTPPVAPTPTEPAIKIQYSNETPISTLFEQFPEYKEDATINKYKTVGEFLKGHKELNSKLGTMIALPKETATEEEKTEILNKIYQQLGKPEKPDGYELSKDVPEGLQLNEQLQATFKETAHKLNLTAAQAKGLQDFHNSAMKELLTDSAISAEKDATIQVAELKTTWGADYKDRTQIAINTAKQLLSAETLAYLDKTGLGNNANFVKDFYKISSKFSGEKPLINPGNPSPENDAASLEAEARKLRRDPDFARDKTKQQRLNEINQRRAELLYEQK